MRPTFPYPPAPPLLDLLQGNSEWKLLNLTNRVEALVYNDNMGTMDLAIFEITIRRNPLYYIYMIVFPSFIINFVSIVGVFLNGADKMSRVSYLCHFSFFLLVEINNDYFNEIDNVIILIDNFNEINNDYNFMRQ